MPLPDVSTIGQIMLFPGKFVPAGWFLCDGSLLSIQQYPALFSVIGITYGYGGGNFYLDYENMTHFGIPDLRGAAPVGAGQVPGLEQVELGLKNNHFFSSHGFSTKGSLGLMYCICYEGNLPIRE